MIASQYKNWTKTPLHLLGQYQKRVPRADGLHDSIQSGPYGAYWGGGQISVISGYPSIRHDVFAATGQVIIRDGHEGEAKRLPTLKTARGPVVAATWTQTTRFKDLSAFAGLLITGDRNPFLGWRIRGFYLGSPVFDGGSSFQAVAGGWGLQFPSSFGRINSAGLYDGVLSVTITYNLELGYTPFGYDNRLRPTGDWDWPAYP